MIFEYVSTLLSLSLLSLSSTIRFYNKLADNRHFCTAKIWWFQNNVVPLHSVINYMYNQLIT